MLSKIINLLKERFVVNKKIVIKPKELAISIYAITLALLVFNIFGVKEQLKNPYVSPLSNGLSVLDKKADSYFLEQNHRIYGFLPYWNLQTSEYLQLDKLTDIAYFALQIESDGTIKKLQNNGELDPGYNNWRNNEDFKQLIKDAKKFNVNIAVSVISHNDENSTNLLNCTSCWDVFVSELIEEMEYNQVYDLNFDLEFVEYVPDSELDKKYTEFVEYVTTRVKSYYPDSFVTVATFADTFDQPRITDAEQLAKVVDGLFIMAYDFNYTLSNKAGPISPINGKGQIAPYDIETMLKDYKKHMPPDKIIMGVPYYGYNWVTESQDAYAIRIEGSDEIGLSMSQPYASIVDTILEVNPEIKWDETAQAPYFSYTSPETGSNRVVHYENAQSLAIKYNIVKSENLLGVGIWALGYDEGYQELWDVLESELILNEASIGL